MNEQLSGGKNGTMSNGINGYIVEHRISYGDERIWKPKELEPMNFSSNDIGFAIAMLVCGFLYWNLINIVSLGAGISIFTGLLCTAIFCYLKINGVKATKESMVCLGIIAFSAANFSLFDGITIKALNFIFLSISVVYWICLSTNRRLDQKLSIYMIGDMINQLLIIPFSNFSCCFEGIRREIAKNKKGKGLLSGLIGLIIFLPVLVLVINLLVEADAAFESLVNGIRFSISSKTLEYILQIALGIPVACYLFGLVYGNRTKRHTGHISVESIEKYAAIFRFAPRITVNSALTALNAIYVVFFLSQASYLFSAFGNIIPEAMTYAEYARRGFFELCSVAGINLAVLAIAHLITHRNSNNQVAPKMLRIETVVLCLFTIILITTAISKMAMYINYYGLTQLRVYTTWFMVFLFIIFIIVAIRQFKNFNGSKIVIVCFIVFFMTLCYGNVDGMIAKYNIDRYMNGTLETVDVIALSELSDAAVPYLYGLYQETDNVALKMSLKTTISQSGSRIVSNDLTFRDFNLQSYKAEIIRSNLL